MAIAFAALSLAILSILYGGRYPAVGLVLIGLALGALIFWHHATDVLKINW